MRTSESNAHSVRTFLCKPKALATRALRRLGSSSARLEGTLYRLNQEATSAWSPSARFTRACGLMAGLTCRALPIGTPGGAGCSLTSIHPALRYKQWGLTTILRGFRVPVAALDRFLQANGLMPTFGDPPSSLDSQTDPASMLLRTKLGDDHGDSKTRLFIPFKKGRKRSDVAYIAYDWVMVFAQRQVNLGEELLDRPPPRFAELRDDMLQFADREGQQKVEDLSALFVVITDEECFPFVEPYLRKVSIRLNESRELDRGILTCF